MIREIIGSEFMDCHKAQEICRNKGLSRSEIKTMKREEGIQTLEVKNSKGERMWLWFDPIAVWEKYHA